MWEPHCGRNAKFVNVTLIFETIIIIVHVPDICSYTYTHIYTIYTHVQHDVKKSLMVMTFFLAPPDEQDISQLLNPLQIRNENGNK